MVALSFRAGGGRVQGREREGKAYAVWVASALLASALALQLSSGRTGLKAEADFASWKALSCSRASQAFFKPEIWGGGGGGGRGAYISRAGLGRGGSKVGAASAPTPGRRSPRSEPRGRPRAPRAAPHAGLRAVGAQASELRAPAWLSGCPPGSSVSEEPRRCWAAFRRPPGSPAAFRDSWALPRQRGGRQRRGGGGRGGRSREKVACSSPGGGGVGGRGKTMPRLRRGGRRERARRAGRPGAGRLRGGARRSEAPASASRRPDAAGDRAGLRQPPPSPPPPPGGKSKSLDLGEDATLSGITTRAGRRPPEPSQQIAD
ncbi:uncharacterized protein [Sagmatias obliquidens]|uniref:uncharacterized protein n=1 Tax=Sagmatias obliquidens TaxID=3371155 RepID=UPI000F441737|nr:uncharacterized protein LOC113627799 [Lagenorhynchus obliquidens]